MPVIVVIFESKLKSVDMVYSAKSNVMKISWAILELLLADNVDRVTEASVLLFTAHAPITNNNLSINQSINHESTTNFPNVMPLWFLFVNGLHARRCPEYNARFATLYNIFKFLIFLLMSTQIFIFRFQHFRLPLLLKCYYPYNWHTCLINLAHYTRWQHSHFVVKETSADSSLTWNKEKQVQCRCLYEYCLL